MIDIVSDPLSSQTWVGEASTSAAHLSVEDYQKEDTDEALGSVVAIPQLEVPYLVYTHSCRIGPSVRTSCVRLITKVFLTCYNAAIFLLLLLYVRNR
ncbi:hypothetical protein Tco_0365073 [Tanacetum coccineum]